MKTLKEIFEELFFELTKGCIAKFDNDHPSEIFYCRDGYILMSFNFKYGWVCISNIFIWSNLESFLVLNNKQIEDLLSSLIKKHYDWNNFKLNNIFKIYNKCPENHFNLK